MSRGWRDAPGPGDLWQPPDDEPDDEPVEIYRFDGYHIVHGRVCIRQTVVEVDPETRKVISYHRNKVVYGADTSTEHFRKYCAAHPRKGPKLLAALEAIGKK